MLVVFELDQSFVLALDLLLHFLHVGENQIFLKFVQVFLDRVVFLALLVLLRVLQNVFFNII